MHGVEVHRHRCVNLHAQRVGISLSLERRTYILRVQRKEHILPTICLHSEVRLSQRRSDRIFVVQESDIVGFDTQPVHLQFIERQRESGGVLLRRVRRSDKHIGQVGRTVRSNIEIDECVIQYRLVHMQIPMVQKLHHIHRSHQRRRSHNSIVLRTGFGIDDQQSVGAQTEAGKGREEGQIHRSYLMLGGNKPVRYIAGDRGQTLRREDHVAHDRHCNHYGQHDTQKRPAYDLERTFHFVVTTLVKLNLIDGYSFS